MMSKLADLQNWMQGVVLDLSSPTPEAVFARVRSGAGLAADLRVQIYARSYRLRLLECLRQEYPILEALVGPTVFELFAHGYATAHPSQSYTLYDFGRGFADYLDAVRPRGAAFDAIEAIPAALARIERAKAQAGRARGVEVAERSAPGPGPFDPFLATVLGFQRSGRFARPDSLHLLALPFDFTPTMDSMERGQGAISPLFEPSFVAVSRARYRVEYHRLEGWQYAWIANLPDGHGPPTGVPQAQLDPRVQAWLPFALAHGLAAREA